MRGIAIAAALIAAGAVMPAFASNAADPLSFRDLEYQQPRDPLTGSNPAFVEVHHASADDLAQPLAAVQAAIPAGIDRQTAEQLLHRAGARCKAPAADGRETCTYHDVETVDEYLDDVTWTVALAMNDDKLASVALDRAWQRH